MATIHQLPGREVSTAPSAQAARMAEINAAALTEGWQLRCVERSGTLELVALAEHAAFEVDRDAWTHVIRHADIGSVLHLRALQVLRAASPDAFEAVMAWARILGFWLENRIAIVDPQDAS